MKKLQLSVEELAVETFDPGEMRGTEGTVEAQAADTFTKLVDTYCGGLSDCCPPSYGINVAMCAPTTVQPECETDITVCPL